MTRTHGADTLDRFMRAPWPIRVSTVVAMCFCLVHQARDNPLGEIFHEAANLRFGQLAPYTGKKRL